MKARALKLCHDKLEIYAKCSSTRTISVVWACRQELNEASKCLGQ